MILNLYKKIKRHSFNNIYKVKSSYFKKKIFAFKQYVFKKRLSDQEINKCLDKDFLPKVKFKENACKRSAEQSAQNCFDIFGKVICFKNEINWHKDFFNNKVVPEWKNAFYQDIKVKKNNATSFYEFMPDIKVPWELSRLQHLPTLGVTGDFKTFKNHINSWIDNNPFLIGVNWVCPMDVAIRTINLIYSFYLLKDSEEDFTKKLINSLYNHAIYLENNFEMFYKPNNHYIADLLGYFYLCFLFDHIKHFQKAKIKTYKKILEQFSIQIQDDGTSYEGSTSYHKLVTEMFLHFYYLCKKNNIVVPKDFINKLKKAEQFIKDCSDYTGDFIQIGDNDCGKVLNNTVDIITSEQKKLSHYPDFGVSIIKNESWHITYRHPTYNKKQPTGHFHQDALAITLSYKGIPILVDSGSYTYTANKAWRNKMRGYDSHNTFYIDDNDLEKEDLFLLKKSEQVDTSKITTESNKITIKNYATHRDATRRDATRRDTMYQNTKAFRELIFDKKELKINDWWENALNKISNWNFIFHPEISLKKISNNKFEIFHKNIKIFYLESNLNFKQQTGYYSPEYGKREECVKLFAQKNITSKKSITILHPAKT